MIQGKVTGMEDAGRRLGKPRRISVLGSEDQVEPSERSLWEARRCETATVEQEAEPAKYSWIKKGKEELVTFLWHRNSKLEFKVWVSWMSVSVSVLLTLQVSWKPSVSREVEA